MKLKVKHEVPLLEYLYSELAPQSRTSVKNALVRGRVSVNGRTVTAYDFRLAENDVVIVDGNGGHRDEKTAAAGKKRKFPGIKIIFEDDWTIIIEKESGVPTISTGKQNERTAYSMVTDYRRESGSGQGERIFIVHRLDRDTSGILLFAKDENTKRILQENWSTIVTERKYLAVAEGLFRTKAGTLTSWLKENPKSLKVSSCPYDNGGKKAVTHFRILAERNGMSAVELELETGRKNQIRAQLSSAGHPVAGDSKYDAATNPFGRLALHAYSIAFIHPHTGKQMKFTSEIPDFLKTVHVQAAQENRRRQSDPH